MIVTGRDRREHAEPDVLAAARDVALMQRGEHRDRRVQPGHGVGERQRQVGRLALVQLSLPGEQAGLGMNDRRERAPAASGPAAPKPETDSMISRGFAAASWS